jgi:ribose transport system permease protein
MTPAPTDPDLAPAPAAMNWRLWMNRLGPLLALIVVYAVFATRAPQMLSLGTLETVTIQTVIVGTAAVGMTMVIISGGIDLSVGSIIAFSSVVGAFLLANVGVNPLLSVCGALLAGGLCGLLNAFIITRAKVVPFIVTLGTLLVVRGLAKGLARSAPINIESPWIIRFIEALAPSERWKLLPPGGWVMILLAGAFWALLRYTRLGRHTYAIGSNEKTARLCGVAVERVKLWAYGLSGLCAGLSGVMLLSRQRQGDPTGAMGSELDVIAAVVIGGGSLAGGEGSIFGSIVGALIMTVIRTGCNQWGLDVWVTQVVTGAIIVLAVALDRLRHRRAA